MAIQTKITVQQMMLKESGDYRVGKYPRYIITLGNSLSSVTVEELATAVANANAAANAAAASQTAAKTSETNSKTSETNANSSKNAAASSATAAAASQTAAKTSETNAKTSETNSKTSENAAKASQTAAKTSETSAAASAQTALDALQGIKDAQDQSPFPDVWAPLSDGLQLLAGFAPYDRIYLGNQFAELPTRSAAFLRSSTATYIDKSGTLQTAVNNEPRFEKDGLLMEGQSTNYFLNSEDPTKWGSTSGLTRTVLTADGATKATTCKVATNVIANNFLVHQSSAISCVVGDHITMSCRFKGDQATTRVMFRFDAPNGTNQGQVNIDFVGNTGTPTTSAIVSVTNRVLPDGYCYATATIKAAVDGDHFGRLYMMPATGTLPVGIEMYFQTVQCEKNTVATSYIPTGSAAATRAYDLLTLPTQGNIGYDKIGDTFSRTLALEFTIDSFLPPSTGTAYVDYLMALGASNDIMIRSTSSLLLSYRGSSGPSVPVTLPFYRKIYAQTIDVANNNTITMYFDGAMNTRTGLTPPNPASSPSTIRCGGNSMVVFHVRNLRIWHQVLTSNQIKGLK